MKKAKNKSPITQINVDKDADKRGYKISKNLRTDQRKSAIEWQAPEFEYQPKDVSWYWLTLMAAIVLLTLAVWQGNFLFAVFVVIAWLALVYSGRRFPAVWNFKINDKGIEISLAKGAGSGSKFYPHNEIEGFDIHPVSEKYKELVLKLKSRFSPYLKINIQTSDEEKIKNFLQGYLPEEEYKSSLADSFSRLIRF